MTPPHHPDPEYPSRQSASPVSPFLPGFIQQPVHQLINSSRQHCRSKPCQIVSDAIEKTTRIQPCFIFFLPAHHPMTRRNAYTFFASHSVHSWAIL